MDICTHYNSELPTSPLSPCQSASLLAHSYKKTLIADFSSRTWAATIFLRSRFYPRRNRSCLDYASCPHLLHSPEIGEYTAQLLKNIIRLPRFLEQSTEALHSLTLNLHSGVISNHPLLPTLSTLGSNRTINCLPSHTSLCHVHLWSTVHAIPRAGKTLSVPPILQI